MKIFYPRGCGGNWLSNLIWHLQVDNFNLPQVDIIFDGQPGCSISFTHGEYTLKTPEIKLFSCKHLFNHYLNDATKVRYPIHNLSTRPWLEQLFDLSNSARYFLTNTEYSDYYCNNIDLDYSLVFRDPGEFTTRLFTLLNNWNTKYTPRREYVYSSIAYYRSTCTDPEEHFNNHDSIIWLGCCHGISLVDKLPLSGTITDIGSAHTLLKPYFAHCAQRIQQEMFTWK